MWRSVNAHHKKSASFEAELILSISLLCTVLYRTLVQYSTVHLNENNLIT